MLESSEAASSSQDPGSGNLAKGTRRLEFGSSNISLKSSTSTRKRQPCKYFLSKERCPFGGHCRYLHATGEPPVEEHGEVVRHQERRVEPRPPLCRYFLSAAGCKYGSQCKFYHPRSRSPSTNDHPPPPLPSVLDHPPPPMPSVVDHPPPPVRHSDAPPPTRESPTGPEGVEEESMLRDMSVFPSLRQTQSSRGHTHTSTTGGQRPTNEQQSRAMPSRGQRSGQRRHGPSELSLEAFFQRAKVAPTRPPVSRPQPKRANTLPDLRQVELEQLEARFHGNQCQLVEKGKERTVYSVEFVPSDPQWSFPYKFVVLEVSFPASYPATPLSVSLPNEQGLPPSLISHANAAIKEYLGGEATGQLMFRPFLHWLDRNIATIFREGAKEAVAQLLSSSSDEVSDHAHSDHAHLSSGEDRSESSSEEEEEDVSDESDAEGDGDMDAPLSPSSLPSLPPKKGTEIRLQGLVMGEGVGTVQCGVVKLVVQCTRCRVHHDVLLKAESPVSHACTRCHATYTLTYHSSLLHPTSITVGFLDLIGCTPVDLVLVGCEAVMVCLECGRENAARGLAYGQPRDAWCRRCHTRLTFMAEQSKFVTHQPGVVAVPETVSSAKTHQKKKRDPGLREGNPLPNFGTCDHYKKSHRWLRFPCCGKAYPCDVCHDSSEDHVMERANRMICGFCSKEQSYTGAKPCVLCGSDLAHVKSSVFWEGGQGCRNKIKMSRNDQHKYSSSQLKSSSKKSERVGQKGKANRAK